MCKRRLKLADLDAQERRITNIFDTEELDVTRKKFKIYLKYLKEHIGLPCELIGVEDFEWEEYYIWEPGDKKEYEKLKKTNPSYKDKFILVHFDCEFIVAFACAENAELKCDAHGFADLQKPLAYCGKGGIENEEAIKVSDFSGIYNSNFYTVILPCV